MSNNSRILKDLMFILSKNKYRDVMFEIHPPNTHSMILEVGCGSGKLGMLYGQNDTVILGDIDEKQLNYSIRLYGALSSMIKNKLNINYMIMDIHNISFQDNSFDLVFNEGVCEHWTGVRRQTCIDEMVRVSRNKVLIIVPNIDNELSEEIAKNTTHTYKGMPKKEHPYTKDELKYRMELAGLENVVVCEEFNRHLLGYGKVEQS